MKCLRCGYCCIHYSVIIVRPEFAIDKTIDEIATECGDEAFMHKTSGIPCPHLKIEDGIANCDVRHLKFYNETPCHAFTQIEQSEDCECRIGCGVRDGRVTL